MTVKKLFRYSRIFISTLIVFALFPTCEVGLGEAVDTAAPSVSISYPPIGAVIKGTFTLAGACSDDKGVASVTVNVKNTDTDASYGTYNATISENSWRLEINGSKRQEISVP